MDASSLHFELDAGHRAVSEQESRVSTAFRARCSASCSIQVDETSTQLQVDLEQALATALNQASPLRFSSAFEISNALSLHSAAFMESARPPQNVNRMNPVES